ncbi:MAG TPA: hypothetical protein ENK22_02140 [Persephonella sp.]|nr:hypothetical protein [Persephonella sp.]
MEKTGISNVYVRKNCFVFRMKYNGKEYFKTLGSVKEIKSRKSLRKLAEELRIKVLSGEWDKEKEVNLKRKKDITLEKLIDRFFYGIKPIGDAHFTKDMKELPK